MTRRQIRASQALVNPNVLQQMTRLDAAQGHHGHAHFWERAALSRRQFIQATGVGAGVLATGASTATGAALPAFTPNAIPGGFTVPGLTEVFHNFAPGVFDPLNTDRSGIFDFHGEIAYAIIDGTGTGVDASGSNRRTFEADMRFMQGVYVDINGKSRDDTFVLI
jgi:hypothetical protein